MHRKATATSRWRSAKWIDEDDLSLRPHTCVRGLRSTGNYPSGSEFLLSNSSKGKNSCLHRWFCTSLAHQRSSSVKSFIACRLRLLLSFDLIEHDLRRTAAQKIAIEQREVFECAFTAAEDPFQERDITKLLRSSEKHRSVEEWIEHAMSKHRKTRRDLFPLSIKENSTARRRRRHVGIWKYWISSLFWFLFLFFYC